LIVLGFVIVDCGEYWGMVKMAGNVGESGCRGWRETLCTAYCFERGLGTGVVLL
nr:hypothetical protein [Tanacetum cinerariifolium]